MALLAMRPEDGSFFGYNERYGLLQDTMRAAGVSLGEWDETVLAWLCGQDVQTVAAVAGWVQRASRADDIPGRCTVTGAKPYNVYGKLEDPTGVLSVALAQWEERNDSKPQPEVREAANTAMDAIDTMTRELYAIRARLVGEIRQSDDATDRRAGELLRRIREEREQ